MRNPAEFSTSGLSLVLNGTPCIQELDVSVNVTGCTVVLGPNGAGKSLLLKLLHGLLPPTSGEIYHQGEPLKEQHRATQAMVFQKPVLLRRTVAQNLDFVLQGNRRDRKAQREALLTRVNLLDKALQPARSLSGGEQQRLALVRALATQPNTLFLDEATANLDAQSTVIMESLLADELAGGTSVIMVTHDLAQARRLADHVLMVYRGKVIESAPANQFFTAPQTTQAKALLAGEPVV